MAEAPKGVVLQDERLNQSGSHPQFELTPQTGLNGETERRQNAKIEDELAGGRPVRRGGERLKTFADAEEITQK